MKQDYSQTMARLPDLELLHLLENPTDIDPAAIMAAKNEWINRGLSDENVEEVRQRKLAVETDRQKHSISLPSGLTNSWRKYVGWVHSKPPQMQLFVWMCLVSLFLVIYNTIISLTVSSGTLVSFLIGPESNTWGLFDWLMVIYYFGSIAIVLVGTIQLIFLKKWAYWLTTGLLTFSITNEIIIWPIHLIDKLEYWNSPLFSVGSFITPYNIISIIVGSMGLISSLLLLYLLTRNQIREAFNISLHGMKRLLIAGGALGGIAAILRLYNWWQYSFPVYTGYPSDLFNPVP